MSRDSNELRAALADQILALEASCAGYDSGKDWESLRLATTVFTIVNDGRSKAKSILTQLNIRDKIEFYSYAYKLPDGNIFNGTPLIMMYSGGEGEPKYVPKLDNGPPFPVRKLKFDEWWGQPIFYNTRGRTLSRLELVFSLRSQDGGSHFDPELSNNQYIEFKKSGVGAFLGGEYRSGAPHATMRHIAFELLKSLDGIL